MVAQGDEFLYQEAIYDRSERAIASSGTNITMCQRGFSLMHDADR